MRSPYFPRNSPRSHQKSLRRVIAVAFVVVLALAAIPGLFIALLLPAWRTAEHPIENPGRVLLVTAHPDDETVFFGPTISGLHEQGHEVFLLCFTTGNAHGLGPIRTKELRGAALTLGIDDKHLNVIDYADIQDGKTVQWNMVTVNELLRQAVDRQAISTIVTFDRGGITGHRNHEACWEGVRNFVRQCRSTEIRACPNAWSVISSGKWRRYSQEAGTAPETVQGDEHEARYINRHLLRLYWAMWSHKTQWRWWMHVVFTRYAFVNTLTSIL